MIEPTSMEGQLGNTEAAHCKRCGGWVYNDPQPGMRDWLVCINCGWEGQPWRLAEPNGVDGAAERLQPGTGPLVFHDRGAAAHQAPPGNAA